jgi:hypothetical protein
VHAWRNRERRRSAPRRRAKAHTTYPAGVSRRGIIAPDHDPALVIGIATAYWLVRSIANPVARLAAIFGTG